MKDMEKFFTIKEICDFFQVERRYVLRIIKNKELIAYKVGRSWRIRESDFKKWLESKRNTE